MFCRKWRKTTDDREGADHWVIVQHGPSLPSFFTMAAQRWFIQSCRCDECGPFLGQWAACHPAALNRRQRGEAIVFRPSSKNTHKPTTHPPTHTHAHTHYTVNPTFMCWHIQYTNQQQFTGHCDGKYVLLLLMGYNFNFKPDLSIILLLLDAFLHSPFEYNLLLFTVVMSDLWGKCSIFCSVRLKFKKESTVMKL